MKAQGAGARLGALLSVIQGQNPYDVDGVGINEDNDIVISPDQAQALYRGVSRGLPRCFSEGYAAVEEGCAMPKGLCHVCVADGRRIHRATDD